MMADSSERVFLGELLEIAIVDLNNIEILRLSPGGVPAHLQQQFVDSKNKFGRMARPFINVAYALNIDGKPLEDFIRTGDSDFVAGAIQVMRRIQAIDTQKRLLNQKSNGGAAGGSGANHALPIQGQAPAQGSTPKPESSGMHKSLSGAELDVLRQAFQRFYNTLDATTLPMPDGARRVEGVADAVALSEATDELTRHLAAAYAVLFQRFGVSVESIPAWFQVQGSDSPDGPWEPIPKEAISVRKMTIGGSGPDALLLAAIDSAMRATWFPPEKWNAMQAKNPGGNHQRWHVHNVIPAGDLALLDSVRKKLELCKPSANPVKTVTGIEAGLSSGPLVNPADAQRLIRACGSWSVNAADQLRKIVACTAATPGREWDAWGPDGPLVPAEWLWDTAYLKTTLNTYEPKVTEVVEKAYSVVLAWHGAISPESALVADLVEKVKAAVFELKELEGRLRGDNPPAWVEEIKSFWQSEYHTQTRAFWDRFMLDEKPDTPSPSDLIRMLEYWDSFLVTPETYRAHGIELREAKYWVNNRARKAIHYLKAAAESRGLNSNLVSRAHAIIDRYSLEAIYWGRFSNGVGVSFWTRDFATKAGAFITRPLKPPTEGEYAVIQDGINELLRLKVKLAEECKREKPGDDKRLEPQQEPGGEERYFPASHFYKTHEGKEKGVKAATLRKRCSIKNDIRKKRIGGTDQNPIFAYCEADVWRAWPHLFHK